jgi:lipopolysaccharide transport system permease protein
LAPIGILYNDIGKAIPLSMQMLMYVSPVVYMSPKSGLMKQLMQYNPFYYMMDDLRNTLTGASIEHGTFWLIFGLITILLFAFSLIVYRVSMPIITERMSA